MIFCADEPSRPCQSVLSLKIAAKSSEADFVLGTKPPIHLNEVMARDEITRVTPRPQRFAAPACSATTIDPTWCASSPIGSTDRVCVTPAKNPVTHDAG